jgi:hypothetical protein
MANILQGVDSPLNTIQFRDNIGASMSIASLYDYNVYVYYVKNGIKTNVATFKKTPVGNDKSIIVVDTYTIGFIVDRLATKLCPVGDIFAECVIKMSASSDYISSLDKKGQDGFLIGTIVQSANPNGMG